VGLGLGSPLVSSQFCEAMRSTHVTVGKQCSEEFGCPVGVSGLLTVAGGRAGGMTQVVNICLASLKS
jgi:hypothetical protein